MVGTTDAAWCGKVRFAECDAKPGRYYVTCRDETGRVSFLLGPFTQHGYGKNGHAQALGWLRAAKRHVADRYPRSMGWTFGTARRDLCRPAIVGKLNGVLLPAVA